MKKVLRWVVLLISLGMACTGISLMSAGLAGHALSPVDRPDQTALVIFYVGLVLFAVAWVLGMLAFPTFTAIGGLCLVPILVLGGFALAIMAMVLGRVAPLDFDGDRAAHDTLLGAALCLVIAVALSVNFAVCLRRARSRIAVRHLLHVTAVGYGSLFFLLGLATSISAIVGVFQAGGVRSVSLQQAVAATGLVVWFAGAGAVLLWQGAGALTRVGSTSYRPPPLWLPVAAAVVAVGLGALLMQSGSATRLMPFAHGVAMVAPGLALIALVSIESRRTGVSSSSWREVLLMIGYGAGVATVMAGIIEVFAESASIIVYLTLHGDFDGVRTASEFSRVRNDAVFYIGRGGFIAVTLLIYALLGPLAEEFSKGFGVRLLKNHRPSQYRAFLWGVSSGVGFGMVEANLYGLSAFVRSPYRWWDTILVRGASSSLHALASGVVGIAWFYAFAGRRLRFLALFLVAVGMHGSWNGLLVLTTVRVLPGFKTFTEHNLEIILDVSAAIIALPILFMLRLLSRSLAADDLQPPSEPPPLPGELEAGVTIAPTGLPLAPTPSPL